MKTIDVFIIAAAPFNNSDNDNNKLIPVANIDRQFAVYQVLFYASLPTLNLLTIHDRVDIISILLEKLRHEDVQLHTMVTQL